MFLQAGQKTKLVAASAWYLNPRVRSSFRTATRHSGGRSSVTGKVVARSRGRILHTKLIYNINHAYTGQMSSSVCLGLIRPTHVKSLRALGLFFNSVSGWFLTKLSTVFEPFSYSRAKPTNHIQSLVQTPFIWIRPLQELDFHSRVCLFGAATPTLLRAARAPGTSAILLTPEFLSGWSLVILPSKQFKVYESGSVYAQLGYVQTHVRDKLPLRTAGRAVNMGRKPITRGTVKNAKDHPNGGRSRALRLSRTPWGLPTKKSRKSYRALAL